MYTTKEQDKQQEDFLVFRMYWIYTSSLILSSMMNTITTDTTDTLYVFKTNFQKKMKMNEWKMFSKILNVVKQITRKKMKMNEWEIYYFMF